MGEGGPKAKYQANVAAIKLLKYLEETTGQATPEQQEVLSRYVGWGGVPEAFDPSKTAWAKEFAELKELLAPEEYEAARASTLNAHYTSPTVIRAIYDAVEQMGFRTGNILEPSCGVGNFFGMLRRAWPGAVCTRGAGQHFRAHRQAALPQSRHHRGGLRDHRPARLL